ncbi:hypothetical protein [Curtobacterium sp. VKM Ac-2884]|uniref:hypothetical protein n=1 Tax=Curtobacterium sp. VKM Ac-2884 TaxID=2783818 RepID=UPI00188C0F69|nr:hypothetical protein [Curtobacterium sp. VKM Ac-2884]MBF4603775.1 hypothetical protein [Curtobacterium sp. VKM Ac-2884]
MTVYDWRMRQRGGTEAENLSSGDVPLERELVVASDTGAFWIGDGATALTDLPKQGPITLDPTSGVATLPDGTQLASLSSQTYLLPTVAREAMARVLADRTTPEGAAVVGAQGDNAMTYLGTKQIEVLKSSDDDRPGVWEFIHDSPTGYLFHLMTGADTQPASALLGLGIDNGGQGIFINNKKRGVGIAIQQNDSIESPTAYGVYANQSSKTAPLIHVDHADGAKHALRIISSESKVETNELIEVITTGVSGGGYVSSRSGAVYWRSDINATQGKRVRAVQAIAADGNSTAIEPDALRLSTWNGADGGYWQKRIGQNGQSMLLQVADGTSGGRDTAPAKWFTGVEVKQVNGLAGGTQLGFYGAVPVGRQAAPAAATDAASTQAAVNNLRSALIALGLLS